jgi:hypothetical protein
MNVGNARIERYLADGQILGSTRAPAGVNIGRVALNPDGGMLVPTAGGDGTLLRVLTPSGELIHRIGTPRVPHTRQFDIGAFRELAEQLEVPDYYGNDVLAAMTTDSVFWLAFGAVPELVAYASDGSLLASIRVPDSLAAPILEDYRERNREATESSRFHQLAYFADLRVAGDFVWALLRNPVDADARVLLVHRTDGLVADLVFPGARDVWRIAPDPAHRMIYLSSASASEVYRAALPEGVGR